MDWAAYKMWNMAVVDGAAVYEMLTAFNFYQFRVHFASP